MDKIINSKEFKMEERTSTSPRGNKKTDKSLSAKPPGKPKPKSDSKTNKKPSK